MSFKTSKNLFNVGHEQFATDRYTFGHTVVEAKSPAETMFKLKNTSLAMLGKYTFNKSLTELKKVLPLINISYDELVQFDKISMLKERFSFGKSYLV